MLVIIVLFACSLNCQFLYPQDPSLKKDNGINPLGFLQDLTDDLETRANYYTPITQNVSLFKKKFEFNLSGGMKLGQYTVGFYLQSAMAITSHASIMFNYAYICAPTPLYGNDDKDPPNFEENMYDVGLGYFLPITKRLVFESYAGYGSGTIRNNASWFISYQSPPTFINYKSRIRYSSFFLQPAAGLRTKYVELALSARFRLVNYTSIECIDGTGNTGDFFEDLHSAPIKYFLEPALTARFGGESVKAHIQFGISCLFKNTGKKYNDPTFLNIGILFQPGRKDKNVSTPSS